jgi:hypothetical protein
MFLAFVLMVAVLFVFMVGRTYVRRWRQNRGSIDPDATHRARLVRAQGDAQPLNGPRAEPPPGSTGGFFG